MRPVPLVRDLMTRRPAIVDPESSMGDLARIFMTKSVPSVAVVDADGKFHGLISTQGLMIAMMDLVYEEVPPEPVKSYLDPKQPRITEETSLMAVVDLFAKGGYSSRALPVLRGDRFVGIVTRLDVVRAVISYFADAREKGEQTLYISALKGSDEKPGF